MSAMIRGSWIVLMCLAGMTIALPTEAGEEIRISILSVLSPKEIAITVIEPERALVRVEQPSEYKEFVWPNRAPIHVKIQGKSLVWGPRNQPATKLELYCTGGCQLQLEIPHILTREYIGNLELTAFNNTVNIVLSILREDLVSSITVSEMSGMAKPEAIRAFAVLSRTFLSTPPRHTERRADVCDTTHCQVFQGRLPSPELERWVLSTRNLVLLYRSRTFSPFYSKNCGGRTASYEDVWGQPSPNYPYSSVACLCGENPLLWSFELTPELLASITNIPGATLKKIASQRLQVTNATETLLLLQEQFRILSGRKIGWDKILSNRFEIESRASTFLLNGVGNGHSAGFCQTGAFLMASQGQSFEQILLHYFPHAEIAEP